MISLLKNNNSNNNKEIRCGKNKIQRGKIHIRKTKAL